MSKSSIWPIDSTISYVITLDKSRLGSNGYEGVLYIPQSSGAGASSSDCLILFLSRTRFGGRSYPFCRDIVGIFNYPSQMGCGLFGLGNTTRLEREKPDICHVRDCSLQLILCQYFPSSSAVSRIFQLIWIQNFLDPRPVVINRLRSLVYQIIYPLLGAEIVRFISFRKGMTSKRAT